MGVSPGDARGAERALRVEVLDRAIHSEGDVKTVLEVKRDDEPAVGRARDDSGVT
jgi:hypothetical protein